MSSNGYPVAHTEQSPLPVGLPKPKRGPRPDVQLRNLTIQQDLANVTISAQDPDIQPFFHAGAVAGSLRAKQRASSARASRFDATPATHPDDTEGRREATERNMAMYGADTTDTAPVLPSPVLRRPYVHKLRKANATAAPVSC